MPDAFIYDHVRTPRGKGRASGALHTVTPIELASTALRAIRDRNELVVNGSKTFITNGQMADVVIVVAKTDPTKGAKGTSLVLVEAGTEGFRKGRNLDKLGLKAQDTSELFFDDVRVPMTNLLGEEGKGFVYLMQELAWERLQVAIGAVANMEAALAWTIDSPRSARPSASRLSSSRIPASSWRR